MPTAVSAAYVPAFTHMSPVIHCGTQVVTPTPPTHIHFPRQEWGGGSQEFEDTMQTGPWRQHLNPRTWKRVPLRMIGEPRWVGLVETANLKLGPIGERDRGKYS